MATKITQSPAIASDEAAKPASAPAPKVETAEDVRRRRAGVACFL